MKKFTFKFKSWILSNFQLFTVVLLLFAIILIIKHQSDIRNLHDYVDNISGTVSNTQYSVDDLKSSIYDVKSSIEDVESSLGYQIQEVKSTIILWSN